MKRLFLFISLCLVAITAQADRRALLLSKKAPTGGGGGGPTFPASGVVYYKMDEASGTRVDFYTGNDLSEGGTVNANTGRINNGVTNNAGSVFLTRGDTADLSIGTDVDWTWSFWMWHNDVTGSHGIIDKVGVAATDGYAIFMFNNGMVFRRYASGANTDASPTTTFSANQWYHVAIRYNQSQVIFNINGGANETTSFTGDVPDESNNFEVGASSLLGGAYWDGALDEFGFWKRALSDGEVSDLYNGGAGLQP